MRTGDVEYELVSGIPHYTGAAADMALDHCAHAWITAGEDIRSTCMRELAKEPSPRQAYVAAKGGFDNRVDFFDYHYGCGHLVNSSHEELEHIFIEAEEPLEAHLSFDDSNGMFFHSETQRTWIDSSLVGQELLELNEFIDAHTRVFEVFLVTRDLAVDSLFYSLLRIQFTLRADGSVGFDYRSIFSPIMQFTYGMDGYAWLFKEVVVCEVMFAALFAFFLYREVTQLVFGRIIPGIQACREPSDAKVEPAAAAAAASRPRNNESCDVTPTFLTGADSGQGGSVDGNSRAGRDEEALEGGESNSEMGTELVDFDAGDDDMGVVEASKPARKKRQSWHRKLEEQEAAPNLVEKIKKAEARRARAQRPLTERVHSMGTSFMGGLNMNTRSDEAAEDTDELKELIEDYLLPDSKGMGDILDWVTICTIVAGLVHRVLYVNLALEIHDLFLHLDDGENFNHFMENIVDDFEELDHIVSNIRIISLVIVIVGLFQFFRYLHFDRRFAIVTDTIMASSVDLIPVLAIFGVVCLSYAVMGTAIYGQDLLEFADIGSSLSSLFLMILGQFDGYYDSEWDLLWL
jgi:hypothetical protein